MRHLTTMRPLPYRRQLLWRRIAIVLGAVLLFLLVFGVPLPSLYAFLPGPARDVGRLINVSDKPTFSSEGKLYLTTVRVDTQVTFAEWVADSLDPDRSIVTKGQVIPRGQSLEDLEKVQRAEMQESQRLAQEVALVALGRQPPSGDGALIETTVEELPADGVLRPGDVIVSVDGRPVQTACDAGQAVSAHGVGERVTLQIRRAGELEAFELETVAGPDTDAAVIGVSLSDVNYDFDPGVTVDFKTGHIAGPSAGLMFSLALYDKLNAGDLTGGRRIAGTGTIGCDGEVGPIGGVEQKVAGAEAEGVDIFLAPTADAPAARRAANDIDVVSIATFDDAVEYLEELS
ncbi:MAG: PDZ domain-containing protein [Actinobacteria bacterium]|nr:PDZ domain-containing protein [Actinomycetota bacterium]